MTIKTCEQGPALTSISIDIGKDVFHIVGFDREGRIALRRKIRRLALVKVLTHPGVIEAPSHDEVVRKAWGVCGVACSVEDFRAARWRAGYAPTQAGNWWRLALPDETPNLSRHPYRRIGAWHRL